MYRDYGDAAWAAFEYAQHFLDATQKTLEAAELDRHNLETLGIAPASKTTHEARQAFELIRQRGHALQSLVDLVDAEIDDAFDELIGSTRNVPLAYETGNLRSAAWDAAQWIRSILIESQTHGDRLGNWIPEAVEGAGCVDVLRKTVGQLGLAEPIAGRLLLEATVAPRPLFAIETCSAAELYQPAGYIEAASDHAGDEPVKHETPVAVNRKRRGPQGATDEELQEARRIRTAYNSAVVENGGRPLRGEIKMEFCDRHLIEPESLDSALSLTKPSRENRRKKAAKKAGAAK